MTMDKFYDQALAAQLLDVFILERSTSNNLQCFNFSEDSANQLSIETQGKLAKLVNNAGTSDMEEASVGLQGIVAQVSLPPFADNTGQSHQRLSQLCQGVTITGLSSTNFVTMMDKLRHAHSLFSRFTPGGRLRSPEFISTQDFESRNGTVNFPTISTGNRFFTPSHLAAGLQPTAVTKDIDPSGVLKKADSRRLIHTEDNEVKYYIMSKSNDKIK
ncbi:hypothetical protein PC9H_008889 [Pleurotus ostreatus]|uniref:Uncharacterized protein n=2 Tax=Pleurotus TaxID=5320 RepID=A0A8H6ZWN8_PLEOS|nr:uncharacterized protein PC9H_008889 [Pleurotus ostreatus]KAF7426520.1 hypothetical protein PC9H_008889 [Pleurotus ostreatus]KAG9221986.1 hypothetical protein CCMSSC00406_0009194 [Pleurotus cornucopiae]